MGDAANPAPGVAVNAALEFMTETEDWATNERTRKKILRLYQETVGKDPPPAVTNFAWVRLRVGYEITRCRAENEGMTLTQKWQDRYEAVKAWDHDRYVELSGQAKIGLPGAENDMRKVKEVNSAKRKATKADGTPKTAGPGRKYTGRTLGLNVGNTWIHVFQEEANAAVAKKALRTDDQIGDFMQAEFPGGSPSLRHVKIHRNAYNAGTLRGLTGAPKDQAPVPGKEPKPAKEGKQKPKPKAAEAPKPKKIRVRKAAPKA